VLFERFFVSLISQIPLIAIALVLAVIGWHRLAASHRKAALWLVVGMLLFALRWVLGALGTAYSASLRYQHLEGRGSLNEIASALALNLLALHSLLALSLFCIWMAAVTDRRVLGNGGSAT
jgi:hypothetical protein